MWRGRDHRCITVLHHWPAVHHLAAVRWISRHYCAKTVLPWVNPLLNFIFRSTSPSRPNKVGLKCPSTRPSVRQSTKRFFDLNEIWYVGRGRWVMYDGVQYDPIQGQGHDPWNSKVRLFLNAISSPIYNGGWQMTTHSEIWAQYLQLIGAGFLIFGLVFVSCDFEVGRNVTCEEPTVSPVRG